MLPDYDTGFQTATVEFESPEDALFAQTKETKKFDGESIRISLGTFSTLFVTNFPPQADEQFIRDLFSPVCQTGSLCLSRQPYHKSANNDYLVRQHRRYSLSLAQV